ncbi:MAG: hypothetical protein ACTIA6_16040 [Pseudoclavibacter sp.]
MPDDSIASRNTTDFVISNLHTEGRFAEAARRPRLTLDIEENPGHRAPISTRGR